MALLVYHAAVAARTAPNYIPFSNDLWGGYENTYRILGKDDADLGGGLKQVNEYLSREGISDCWIRVIAAPDLLRYMSPCNRIAGSRNLVDPVPSVIEGTVILGVRQIPPEGGEDYSPIAKSEPVALIGGTNFVYRGRFEIPLAAALSRIQRSSYFLRVNQIDQAIAEARQAVELAPNDPRPHLALGLALLQAAQQKEEARRELETAASLANKDPGFRSMEVQAQKELGRLNGQ